MSIVFATDLESEKTPWYDHETAIEGQSSLSSNITSGNLSQEKLALYRRRLVERYDFQDAEFEAWKKCFTAHGCLAEQSTSEPTPPLFTSAAHPSNDKLPPCNEAVGITVSYDMGWQKRGKP